MSCCNHVFIGCDKPQVLVWIVRYKYCKLYVKKRVHATVNFGRISSAGGAAGVNLSQVVAAVGFFRSARQRKP